MLHEHALRDVGGRAAETWVVGDTSNDLLAAARLGCKAILVRTGHGHAAQHDPTPRDAVVDTVLDAAHHILGARADRAPGG
jgi:phosphoglycolate phosphatase-like HAD superfamily hydrolase